MTFEEYRRYDGLGLAQLVARGEVQAAELLEVAIGRAESVNGRLNGLVIPLYDAARRARIVSGRPFSGVPMLAKDLLQEMAGAPHYMANKALKAADTRAKYTSEIVNRWRAAGVNIFGRTNASEFGSKGITEPDAWGPARNPWNTGHTPGGSSGGSAAMVAAGVVPIAGGNDGGGSIRIPAACCGLFGLKPGRGRTPWGPGISELLHGLSMNHVITRSVRDSAAMLDLTAGPQRGDLFYIAPPERPYLEETTHDPPALRIAVSTKSPIGTPVDADAIEAVKRTAELLESLGHVVEEAEPAIDGHAMTHDWLKLWFVGAHELVALVRRMTGCTAGTRSFEFDTILSAAVGKRVRGYELERALSNRQTYTRALGRFLSAGSFGPGPSESPAGTRGETSSDSPSGSPFQARARRYDLWMTPTLGRPPAPVGAVSTPVWQESLGKILTRFGMAGLIYRSGIVEKKTEEYLTYTPFTQIANMTGVPAMSVPLHWCAEGLPMGVQFISDHGGEAMLLSLAAQLERAAPWFDRVPEL